MTNWLDHAHDARDTLAVLPALPSDDPRIPNLLAEAQVHATLALVEQQRIANLIALAGQAHARFANYAGEAGGIGTLFSYGGTETDNMRVRDDIAAALGIREVAS